MNGSTLFVGGMTSIGLVIGVAQLASLPEPKDKLTSSDAPIVVLDDPVIPLPPSPPPTPVSSMPAAAMQAAPMDPRDPNSPAGRARTALDDLVPKGYLTTDPEGWPLWHNPIIGWVVVDSYGNVSEYPIYRYNQSIWAGGIAPVVELNHPEYMDRHDRLKNHDIGFDPTKLDRINY